MIDLQTIESKEQVVRELEERGVCIGKVHPDLYHGMKGGLPYPVISKSSLHEFAACPWVYRWRQVMGRPLESSGFRIGSAVDCALLTPDIWKEKYVVEEVNRLTKAGKARIAELEAAGKTLLKHEEAKAVATATEHAGVALGALGLRLDETYSSQVGMWVYTEELDGEKLARPVILTGMLDIMPHEGPRLLDLKTTSKPLTNERQVLYAARDFGYGVQAALYRDLFEACTGEHREEFGFLFVEQAEPCLVRYLLLDEGQMVRQRQLYVQQVLEMALALATDSWGNFILPDVVGEF